MTTFVRLISISAVAFGVAVPAANTYAQGIPVVGESGDNVAHAVVTAQQLEPQVQTLEKQYQATNAVVEQLARLNATDMQILAQLEVLTVQKANNTK